MNRYSVVAGFGALVVLMTAAGAQSLTGTNTVDSGDIVDGTIITQDLKTGAMSGGAILDGAVATPDLKDGAVTGTKVLDGSLQTADVSSLFGTFSKDFGSVPAFSCFTTGIDLGAGGDLSTAVFVLTAGEDWPDNVSVHAENSATADFLRLTACNVTAAPIDPGPTDFHYVAFGTSAP